MLWLGWKSLEIRGLMVFRARIQPVRPQWVTLHFYILLNCVWMDSLLLCTPCRGRCEAEWGQGEAGSSSLVPLSHSLCRLTLVKVSGHQLQVSIGLNAIQCNGQSGTSVLTGLNGSYKLGQQQQVSCIAVALHIVILYINSDFNVLVCQKTWDYQRLIWCTSWL